MEEITTEMNAISESSFNKFIEFVEGSLILSTECKMRIRSMLFEITYLRGSRILNFHEIDQKIWFLVDGLAREIRVNDQTYCEKTVWFWLPVNFMYTQSFFIQEPSERIIEIEETSKVLYIGYADWIMLKKLYRETELITEKIRAADERIRWDHNEDIKQLSTAKRYEKNKKKLLKLFSKTKLRYIADYMGMSSDTLGRLRKRIN